MTYSEFIDSLSAAHPDSDMRLVLKALWYDRQGDWQRAHQLVQDEGDRPAAHIHAYLHRKEGDSFNADYWYRRAGTVRPDVDLEIEWVELVKKYLA